MLKQLFLQFQNTGTGIIAVAVITAAKAPDNFTAIRVLFFFFCANTLLP
jgi:hypothetical protein